MRALVSLIVVAAIAFGIYYFALRNVAPGGEGTTATQAITLTGVKNDLNAIAKAQRIYLTQNGNYGSMEELTSSAALSFAPVSRDGYEYIVEPRGNTFTVTARHTGPDRGVRWPTLVIDQTMQIRETD